MCFLLSEFKSLNATAATTFPTLQFSKDDGTKTEPVKRSFYDSISVQGILESGATVSYASTCTTDATPEYLQWIIAGDKGALKFEGPSSFIAFAQPTLSKSVGGNIVMKGYEMIGGAPASWEEVKVETAEFGGIGQAYAAYAEGSKYYVDFDQALKRHQMVEAIYRSIEKGTRESY